MSDLDTLALRRLLVYAHQAIDTQETHVGDQLRAALRDGHVSLRFFPRDGAVFGAVDVDGYPVCEVDIRNLVPLDDIL